MALRPGAWIIHTGQLGILVEQKAEKIWLVHDVDDNGETIMRPAIGQEAVCPMTGNPRPHVTDEQFVIESEIREAREEEIPVTRRMLLPQ